MRTTLDNLYTLSLSLSLSFSRSPSPLPFPLPLPPSFSLPPSLSFYFPLSSNIVLFFFHSFIISLPLSVLILHSSKKKQIIRISSKTECNGEPCPVMHIANQIPSSFLPYFTYMHRTIQLKSSISGTSSLIHWADVNLFESLSDCRYLTERVQSTFIREEDSERNTLSP